MMERKLPFPLVVLKGHEGAISALHFVEEDDAFNIKPCLISGSDIGEIFFWNLKTYRTSYRLTGHEKKNIIYLCYYKSSLLSQGSDNYINIWNLLNQQWIVIRKLERLNTGFCASVLYTVEQTAHLIALNQDKSVINIFNYDTGKKENSFKINSSTGMCMCMKVIQQDLKTLVLIGYENGHVGLWDLESESERSSLKCHDEPVMCMDYDSKHKMRGISGSVDKIIQTWKITEQLDLIKVQQVSITNPGINLVKIRDDGKVVFTGGWDYNIRVFSWKTLKQLAVIPFHTNSIQCLVCYNEHIGKNKSVVASGSKDKNIVLWSLY